jgi:transposase
VKTAYTGYKRENFNFKKPCYELVITTMTKAKKAKTKVKVSEAIDSARKSLEKEEHVSASLKSAVTGLIDLVVVLSNHLGVNSSNSSKPPSQDPNREKKTRQARGHRRKPGGQKGHKGSHLKQVEKPTSVEDIEIDRRTLPPGEYRSHGFESRQVFEVEVSLHVTEYRAEVLMNEDGVEFVAEFPKGVTEPAQYGSSVKAHSVYMSQFQLVPLDRVRDHFHDQVRVPLSKGSVSNWNAQAYQLLEPFEEWARRELIQAVCNNADETGINVGGKRLWLHSVSNEKVTLFHADERRGQEAMDRMKILPHFKGILMHDHWKPYFRYEGCDHALCNAHHLRELEAAIEFDAQKWAKGMQGLLIEMKDAVEKAGGSLSKKRADWFRKRYRRVLRAADQECPHNLKSRAQSKSRNLLERLRDFETETLRFLEDANVPFTNNRGENDIRMTKVQQKISGCFRSMDGARIFCRVRSYIITCRKNGIGPSQALKLLFDGRSPGFMK